MSASIAIRPGAYVARPADLRPSFVGLVRGELFKVSRQRATWIMAALLVGILCFPYLVTSLRPNLKELFELTPARSLYIMMGSNLLVLRVFSGTFLILLTARLIGMEYSSGTIRVLLGRGVGRLQLLGAKLLTMALIALAVLVVAVVLNFILSLALLQIVFGNLDILKSLPTGFWNDTLVYLATVAISMGVTILMATAVTVIGRSLAIGLSVGVSFFAADNIGVIFFLLANKLTNSNFWLLVTGDLLGPNLNVMAPSVLPDRAAPAGFASGAMAPPLVPVTGGHTLLVTAIWAAAFAVTAIVLTWKRDVTE
jgi:ABC-2 type transport system permease protein